MTATLSTLTFASEVTTSEDALALSTLIDAALQSGTVEDRSGKSTGFALDTLHRFFLNRPSIALQRDRELVLETLQTLGSARGYRIAAACENHSTQRGAAFFWAGIADKIRPESLEVAVHAA